MLCYWKKKIFNVVKICLYMCLSLRTLNTCIEHTTLFPHIIIGITFLKAPAIAGELHLPSILPALLPVVHRRAI